MSSDGLAVAVDDMFAVAEVHHRASGLALLAVASLSLGFLGIFDPNHRRVLLWQLSVMAIRSPHFLVKTRWDDPARVRSKDVPVCFIVDAFIVSRAIPIFLVERDNRSTKVPHK
jgi:hypothetical protein